MISCWRACGVHHLCTPLSQPEIPQWHSRTPHSTAQGANLGTHIHVGKVDAAPEIKRRNRPAKARDHPHVADSNTWHPRMRSEKHVFKVLPFYRFNMVQRFNVPKCNLSCKLRCRTKLFQFLMQLIDIGLDCKNPECTT